MRLTFCTETFYTVTSNTMLIMLLILHFAPALSAQTPPAAEAPPIFSSGTKQAALHGVWQLELPASTHPIDPLAASPVQIIFTRPDGEQTHVDAFYRSQADGSAVWIARAYCQSLGTWGWHCSADGSAAELDGRSGKFDVVTAEYPGKLRQHPRDSRQFAYDNGQWFLHIGDTGYRYVTDTEPLWQEYIDQAAATGFTKIRTWFCRSRGAVEALLNADRSGPDEAYWDEIERRLIYAFEQYPHIQFQLIPYGEDTQELRRYGQGDRASQWIARYAQARFSAFPNVQWCISNDRDLEHANCGRCVTPQIIDQIGRDMRAREPWGTLLTNHQMRFSGYDFVDAPWSDIVTIEDMDQVAGEIIAKYFSETDDPIVNDEDRYGVYRSPQHGRYFFRRLMWSSLLSGGHATYGGLDTFEAFAGADQTKGMQGYQTAVESGLLDDGARDFQWIAKFFRKAGIELTGMRPTPGVAGDRPQQFSVISDLHNIIVYAHQASSAEPQSANVSEEAASLELSLPAGNWQMRWFDPRSGQWHPPTDPELGAIPAGELRNLTAPFAGDAVLLLQTTLQ